MPITIKLDDRLHDRRMTMTELADRIGLTLANVSILKTGKAKAIRFSTLEAICGAAVPYLHMRNGLAGGRIANTSGMLFWVWTLFMLVVTSIFTAVLAVRGLWGLRAAARQPGVTPRAGR